MDTSSKGFDCIVEMTDVGDVGFHLGCLECRQEMNIEEGRKGREEGREEEEGR
jgi:hypothetical protein